MKRDIIETLKKRGNDVNGTYELTGETIVHKVYTTDDFVNKFELDEDVISKFIYGITHFEKVDAGPFDTSKYFHLLPSLKNCISHIKTDCLDTRRCVITFPSEHCFQSIQFLVRENSLNVVCFMRSCNAYKNLPYDIWLCSLLGDIFKRNLKAMTGVSLHPVNRITMTIGSLHVFKEDIANVL